MLKVILTDSPTTSDTGGGWQFDIRRPYLGMHYCIALQGLFPSRNRNLEADEKPFAPDEDGFSWQYHRRLSGSFIGELMLFAGNFALLGWSFCDGQLLLITQYIALFSLLGAAYGGDGRTAFVLPNLRGRVPIHVGTSPSLSTYTRGEQGGAESRTLLANNLPSHSHLVQRGNTAWSIEDANVTSTYTP